MISEHNLLAFENCLQALESGENLESCLQNYPALSDELRPALEAAQMARLLSDDYVPNAALHRSRTRLLVNAAGLRSRRPVRHWFGRYPKVAFSALILAIIFFLSWRGLITVSAKALPGDSLYRVKLVGENLSLQFTAGSDTRRALSAQFEQRRVDEVEQLLGLGRVVYVLFTGVVVGQQSGQWKIDGIEVLLDQETKINGEISPGMVVQVAGQTQPGGWVLGSIINLYSYQFIGLVEDISRTEWNISGVKLSVSRNSQIDPAIRLGDMAIVLVQVNDDQSLRARAILRLLVHTAVPSTLKASSDKKAPVLPPLASEVEFTGIVEEISRDSWKIGGREVFISGTTEIKGTISLGDSVKVHALVGGDGSLIALEIENLISAGGNDYQGEKAGGIERGTDSSESGSEGDHGSVDGGPGNETPGEGGGEDGANPDSGDEGTKDGGGGKEGDGGNQGDAGDEGDGGNHDGAGDEGEEDPPEDEGGKDKGEDGGYNEDGGEDKPEK